MAYVVYKPAKNGNQVVDLVTRNDQNAKACAQKLRGLYLAKGWNAWADRVQIKRPRKPEVCREIAESLECDIGGMGNVGYDPKVAIYIETYSLWAKILKGYAEELEILAACDPCR